MVVKILWNLLDLLYDVSYFIYKSADTLKWDALLIYIVYAVGKRSGMKMFRKFLADHFPYLADENEDWRKWATKQIELLGGAKWQPTRLYGRTKRSRKRAAKNSTTSSTLSQPVTARGSQQRRKTMDELTVVIDAGHGGKDTGAISCTKKLEKDFNLSVALKVAERFKSIPEVKVILTRSTDVFIKLTDRSKIANEAKADAFISIHANSFFKSSQGTQTYYTNVISKDFATMFHPYVLKATCFKDGKVNKKSLSVTRKTKMPAILLEPGFLSNPKEEAVLMTEEFQDTFAEAIVQGSCAFFGVTYNVSTANPGLTPITTVIGTEKLPDPGYIKEGISWVPARSVLTILGALWTFQDKQVVLSGTPLDTLLIDNTAYIKARDLVPAGVGVFYEPSLENAKAVLLYPPKQEGAI
ncbi:N-acetylmuramoyl-L-alanine amidase family protein [Paenibacillus rhizophilus]|nr:N-acetylmuramoyl-L-alanine amidase [Paenibacillus rhizophilus]